MVAAHSQKKKKGFGKDNNNKKKVLTDCCCCFFRASILSTGVCNSLFFTFFFPYQRSCHGELLQKPNYQTSAGKNTRATFTYSSVLTTKIFYNYQEKQKQIVLQLIACGQDSR